jgi:transposase
LLTKMLARVDAIDADIADVQARIETEISPFAITVARLDDIPGVGPLAAQVIIAEVGVDMTPVPHSGAPDLLGTVRPGC